MPPLTGLDKVCWTYEMYIKQAFDCESGTDHGATFWYMKALILIEQGDEEWSSKYKFDKELKRVKRFLVDATFEYLIDDRSLDTRKELHQVLIGIIHANASYELLHLIDQGHSLTKNFHWELPN